MEGASTSSERAVLSPLIGGTCAGEPRCSKSFDKASEGNGIKSTEVAKKRSYTDLINRTVFTLLMAYVFLASLSLGIFVGIPLIIGISAIMFVEITRINQKVRKEQQLPSISILKWYFFTVVMVITTVYNLREPLLSVHPGMEIVFSKLPFLTFSAFMVGVVFFVLSLRRGMYRYQFISFTWTFMTLVLMGSQAAAEMRNMMRGMIWFLLPVSCVINNDIWAYIFGKLFGRTKLLSLSPKKTVEGFAGAFVFTVVWSFWFCGVLSYFPDMYCPSVRFDRKFNSQCVKDPLFVQKEVELPAFAQSLTGGFLTTMLVAPAQMHALVLGVFASLLAPFGGFFASGLKRAFKLKDFGDLIPGHGGMTDRMDCQGIMGLFTYFYLRTYVFNEPKCLADVDITRCALLMSVEQRSTLMEALRISLGGSA